MSLVRSALFSVPMIAICMTGFLAAVTQSPITSAIIVMEMVDGHSMVISLMATALLAKAISERLGPQLYPQLALDFVRAHKACSTSSIVSSSSSISANPSRKNEARDCG